jgi:hypothetical protein
LAVPLAVVVAVPGAPSDKVTETACWLAVAYVWVPDTEMAPALSVIMPALVVPSPQLIVAVKSPATLAVLLSVKVATVPLKAWPGL